MDNEETKQNESNLVALSSQIVTLSLGGKSFTARKASLLDIGLLNKFTKEKRESGDDSNLDLDSSLYIIWELIKERHPELKNYQDLGRMLSPIDGVKELTQALEQVGFKKPQSQTIIEKK